MNNIFQSFILALVLFFISLNTYAFTTTHATRESSNEVLKLIYVGTNETFSEAQYHLDLQDGKLEETHIVASLRKGVKPKLLKFIDKNNKVVKQMEFARNFDLDIINNKYVMVTEALARPREDYVYAYNSYYYDNNGKLLWKRARNHYAYFVSPDGETILQALNYGAIQFTDTIEVSTLNSHGIVLNKSFFPTKSEKDNVVFLTHQFSKNSDYLLDFEVEGRKGPVKRIYYLYDRTGHFVSSFEARGLPLKLTSDFSTAMKTSVNLTRNSQSITIFNKYGAQIMSEEVASIGFLPDESVISRITPIGNVFIAKYNWPLHWKYFNHLNLDGGYVYQFNLLNENEVLINLRHQEVNRPNENEVYQSTYFLLSPDYNQVLSQRMIDKSKELFVSRYDGHDMFILYHRDTDTSDPWANEVEQGEPLYDMIQAFHVR